MWLVTAAAVTPVQKVFFKPNFHLCLPNTNVSFPSLWTLVHRQEPFLNLILLLSSTTWHKQKAFNECMWNVKQARNYFCPILHLKTTADTMLKRVYTIILSKSLTAKSPFPLILRFPEPDNIFTKFEETLNKVYDSQMLEKYTVSISMQVYESLYLTKILECSLLKFLVLRIYLPK